jgi:hypothetical protein
VSDAICFVLVGDCIVLSIVILVWLMDGGGRRR